MSNFKIRTSYHIYDSEGNVQKTLFELYTESPTNLITVYLPGKHVVNDAHDESEYVKKCLLAFHKEYFPEIEFKETTKKVDELSTEVEQKKLEDQRRDDFIYAMVLHTIMSGSIVYGVVYRKLAGLLDKAQVGKTYKPNDIVVIEDPNHQEINDEGKLVFVQFNKEFTYNGEPVSDFVKNGSLELNGVGVAYPLTVG
nr:MAG TPA: Protein of unknown function (DUF1366) [Caudoviricetes sp.]